MIQENVAIGVLGSKNRNHSEFNEELLLVKVCQKISLPESMHKRAVSHYKAVGEWLASGNSLLSKAKVRIYPQGSLAIGTTNRPLKSAEFDLDGVGECDLDVEPLEMLNIFEERLKQNSEYRKILERKNRCLRLNFKNDFHIDMLPAKPNFELSAGCVLVPDRELKCWKHSSPKGFAHWFHGRCRIRIVKKFNDSKDYVEPAPDHQEQEEKFILQHLVQILKRARDVEFETRCDLAPVSIVLTALAGELYAGETTVAEAVSNFMDRLKHKIQTEGVRNALRVFNPANPNELLSERWEKNIESYEAFVTWIYDFTETWQAFFETRGIQSKIRLLKGLFGDEAVKGILEALIDEVESARTNSSLFVSGTGSLVFNENKKENVRIVKQNTFFGDL